MPAWPEPDDDLGCLHQSRSAGGIVEAAKAPIEFKILPRHDCRREAQLEGTPDLPAVQLADLPDRRDRILFGIDDATGQAILDHFRN